MEKKPSSRRKGTGGLRDDLETEIVDRQNKEDSQHIQEAM